jgi:hypothetical protein
VADQQQAGLIAAVVVGVPEAEPYRQNQTKTANAPNSQAPAARKGLMILCPNRAQANADNAAPSDAGRAGVVDQEGRRHFDRWDCNSKMRRS